MGNTDFMLRIVARDIDAYERFFFDRLSTLAGIQAITSTVALRRSNHRPSCRSDRQPGQNNGRIVVL
jgi:DNA-binding Lrp family transcriptional regulator